MISCTDCNTTVDPDRPPQPRTGPDGRPERLWCPTCSAWLVYYDRTQQWLNPGSTDYWRRRDAAYALAIAASHRAVLAAFADADAAVPDGWQVAVHQTLPGAGYALRLDPPAGLVDIAAYLAPPDNGHGWHVTIYNRTERIEYPLYIPGGARAAYYSTVRDAVRAAVNAIRIDRHRPL